MVSLSTNYNSKHLLKCWSGINTTVVRIGVLVCSCWCQASVGSHFNVSLWLAPLHVIIYLLHIYWMAVVRLSWSRRWRILCIALRSVSFVPAFIISVVHTIALSSVVYDRLPQQMIRKSTVELLIQASIRTSDLWNPRLVIHVFHKRHLFLSFITQSNGDTFTRNF